MKSNVKLVVAFVLVLILLIVLLYAGIEETGYGRDEPTTEPEPAIKREPTIEPERTTTTCACPDSHLDSATHSPNLTG
jgi:hypothetical protein